MRSKSKKSRYLVGVMLGILTACQAAPKESLLLSKKSPIEIRAMQSREFASSDRNTVIRAVISTMQDLGYTLEKVDASSGAVTGTKLAQLKLSASIYPEGLSQTIVRANALVLIKPIWHQVDAPEFYQRDFFDPLSKSLILVPNTSTSPQLKAHGANVSTKPKAEPPTS